MEKDKIQQTFCKILNCANDVYQKLTKRIDEYLPKTNTNQRIVSSVFMIPLAIYAIFFSKDLFLFCLISIAILMTVEWLDMVRGQVEEKKWRIIGFFYIAIPLYSVYRLRMINTDVLFWMFAIIWVTDIFAFFAGRIIGGKKLAPDISPGKTWAGLYGGVAASAVIGFISSFMFVGGITFFVIASIFLSLIEQGSDLLESKFKRIFGVKDSGNIIPGHGGVLDRLDGMMLSAPFVLLLINLFSKKFGV